MSATRLEAVLYYYPKSTTLALHFPDGSATKDATTSVGQ